MFAVCLFVAEPSGEERSDAIERAAAAATAATTTIDDGRNDDLVYEQRDGDQHDDDDDDSVAASGAGVVRLVRGARMYGADFAFFLLLFFVI